MRRKEIIQEIRGTIFDIVFDECFKSVLLQAAHGRKPGPDMGDNPSYIETYADFYKSECDKVVNQIMEVVEDKAIDCRTVKFYNAMSNLARLRDELSVKTGLIDDMEVFLKEIGHLDDWLGRQRIEREATL